MRIGPIELIMIVFIFGFICLCIVGVILMLTTISAVKRSRLPGANNAGAVPVEKSANDRMRELDELLKNRLISQDEYDAKRAEIIKQI